ncbi:MAG: alpha/beta hydrolase [Bacteroidota bacterium]
MKLIFFLFVLLALLSCQTQELGRLHETIHVRHQGADMPAYVRGNASDDVFLIVLHGAGSFGLAFREGVFQSNLEQDYAVVYWDQRGQSMSQGHYDKPDDLISLMVEDVNALVLTLKHKYGEDITLFLFGHSWGGALGTSVLLTKEYQSNFAGWIDLDGIHDFPQAETARKALMETTASEQIALGNSVEEWNEILDLMATKDSTAENYYESLLYIAQDGLAALRSDGLLLPEIVGSDLLHQTIIANNPIHWRVSDFFHKPFEAGKEIEYSLTDQLPRIEIPVLLLWGKYDFSVPPALGESAFEWLGSTDKQLIIFEKSAHNPLLSEPHEVLPEIRMFIERNK